MNNEAVIGQVPWLLSGYGLQGTEKTRLQSQCTEGDPHQNLNKMFININPVNNIFSGAFHNLSKIYLDNMYEYGRKIASAEYGSFKNSDNKQGFKLN